MILGCTDPEILAYYNNEVVKLISEKYNLLPLEALKEFWESETYKMLCDPELEMWDFAAYALFEIWEVEKVTGEPRNSAYLGRS